MAIFSRKRGESLTVPSAPLTQSTPRLDQLFNAQEASAVSAHSCWSMDPPRPRTADGPRRYQSDLGKDYLAPPTSHRHKLSHSLSKLNLSSMTNLLSSDTPENPSEYQAANFGVPAYQQQEVMDGLSLRDIICAKFNTIVTLIDGEKFSGDEADLTLSPSRLPLWHQEAGYTPQEVSEGRPKGTTKSAKLTLEFSNENYFSKVYLYANSRLPRSLPPMKLYVSPTYYLLFISNRSQISPNISPIMPGCPIFRASLYEAIRPRKGNACRC